MAENEMVGNHQINGHESEQTPDSGGQKSMAGYSPWGRKESDMTEQLSLSLFIFTLLIVVASEEGAGF